MTVFADSLVKIGGYRVELFDVEKNLTELPEVKAAIVVPAKKNGEVKLLTAFIVLNSETEPSLSTTVSIKKQLRERVQSYAIPQKLIYKNDIPRNLNGKPDRVLLQKEADLSFGN